MMAYDRLVTSLASTPRTSRVGDLVTPFAPVKLAHESRSMMLLLTFRASSFLQYLPGMLYNWSPSVTMFGLSVWKLRRKRWSAFASEVHPCKIEKAC